MSARALHSRRHAPRRGFTLIEVMIASALLGFSLIVMFAFHGQAVRSNANARRLTDCTYLAQAQMERLLSLDWQRGAAMAEFTDAGGDAASMGAFDNLEYPSAPAPMTVTQQTVGAWLTPALYTVTWDTTTMDDQETMVRLRVRCVFQDSAFDTLHGTTISSFRYRDS